ncbi:TMhelix containing protein [Vibrio phage 1.251.O._10N.261.55.E5]|nr:TMhelix containing protein [Vibrio phage 1.251.O._10N.261.55.E5]
MKYTKNERRLLSAFSIVLGLFATGAVWWSVGPWAVLGMYCALWANNLSQDLKHLDTGA